MAGLPREVALCVRAITNLQSKLTIEFYNDLVRAATDYSTLTLTEDETKAAAAELIAVVSVATSLTTLVETLGLQERLALPALSDVADGRCVADVNRGRLGIDSHLVTDAARGRAGGLIAHAAVLGINLSAGHLLLHTATLHIVTLRVGTLRVAVLLAAVLLAVLLAVILIAVILVA